MKKLLITLSLTLLVTGCATSPKVTDESRVATIKQFPPPGEGQAGLYIFRDSYLGAALKKSVWVDGKCLGQTAPQTFFYLTVPGNSEHVLATQSEFSPNELRLKTEAGKNYFVRQYIKLGVFVGGANLEVVPEEKARPIIKDLDLIEFGKCPDPAPEQP